MLQNSSLFEVEREPEPRGCQCIYSSSTHDPVRARPALRAGTGPSPVGKILCGREAGKGGGSIIIIMCRRQ